jgi:HlyD family secretion protein
MNRRWLTWIVVVALLVIVAALFFRGRGGEGLLVEPGRIAGRPVFRSYVTASGEIVATRFADIGSNVMGKIVNLPVKEGDVVKAGQLLARIDPVQAQSEVDAASAGVQALEAEVRAAAEQLRAANAEETLAQARATEANLRLDRTRELYSKTLAPKSDLDAAQAAADSANAQVASANAALARTTQARDAAIQRVAQAKAQANRAQDIFAKTSIVSPIDGVVSRLQVREGEMVVIGIQNQPGTTLMTVSDLSGINAEVKVAESDVLRLALGQTARVTLEAIPDRPFSGKVIEIGASALPTAGNVAAAAREFRVVIQLDQPDPALRPGLTGDAEILTVEKQNVLTAPLQAVVIRSGPGASSATAAGADGTASADTRGVFVIENGTAKFVPVKTGIIGGLDIEVEGVNEGTTIVSGPYQVLRDLQDGAKVRTR